jgi:predicted nucleic acid-binding protein
VTRAIVDTGPLVAFLNTRDPRHQWALETFDSFRMPLATCEAVLTEAWFVVRQSKANPNSVLALLSRGIITLDFRLSVELEAVRKLMTKYATVPMALADACLVRMTELDGRATVLTLDSDFHVYRRNGRQVVPVIMP